MTDELQALAARVEALTRPCRETDSEAGRYAPHLVTFLGGVPDQPQYGCVTYTASVNAAMRLVGNRPWSMSVDSDGASATVQGDDGPEHGHAATPALALTAAALRALASKEPEA